MKATKYKKYSNTITVPLLITFLTILIVLFGVIMFYLLNTVFELKKDISSIECTIGSASELQNSNPVEKSFIDRFTELSDHADAEMERLVSMVGIIATIYTVLGALIVFRAPYEIDKRITKLNEYTSQASEAAEEAKYQAKILDVIVRGNDGDLTSFSKIRKMTEIVEAYPNRRDAYLERGFLYDNMKRYDEAINDYLIALKLSGNSDAACFNDIAVAYSNKGDEHKALKYYEKAIELSPNDAEYYTNRGACFDGLGEYKKALNDYKKAIKLDDKCKQAFINRSTTYWNLMKKEKEQEKKDEYYQLMIDDLKKARELDCEDKMVLHLLIERLNSNVNVDAMLADIDERIGDLELEENHTYESFKQYSEAIVYHLSANSTEENGDYLSNIKRLIEKIYKIADEKLFSQIDNDDQQMITFFNVFHVVAMKFYSANDKDSAEKSFLIMYQFNGARKCAALNLAYMKRRHETKITTQSVKELLDECTDFTDGLWCVNTALCHIYGVDGYKNDWNEALSVLNSAEHTQDAILWWSDIETVGKEENNIVMILFHLSNKFNIEDDIEIKERIDMAIADGFCIPQNLI